MIDLLELPKNSDRQKLRDATDEPVVVEVADFDTSDVKKFREQFRKARKTDQPVIPIMIDSFGGSVYGLSSMLSLIDHSDKPVATIVTGHAMSAGAVLLSAGNEGLRYADPHATIMIHEISGFAGGKFNDVKILTSHMKKLNQNLLERMSRNIGKSKDHIKKLVSKQGHGDLFLSAKKAKRLNLVNHLRVPTMGTKIVKTHLFDGKVCNPGNKSL